MSSSVAIANRAGGIIRSIMKSGELGVVDKAKVINDTPGNLVSQHWVFWSAPEYSTKELQFVVQFV